MSPKDLAVHFAPAVADRIGGDLPGWADAIRSWHHDGDPDRFFGRDVYNHRDGYSITWARHMHVVPSPGEAGLEKWERTRSAFNRTSDRLLVYSMHSEQPLQYGILLLALLGDPGGHKALIHGAAAQERREIWDDLAYAHQTSGDMPDGTVTDS